MAGRLEVPMGEFLSTTECRIERIVWRDFRGTHSAKFVTPEGYYLCEVWFQNGVPQMQIRSNTEAVGEMANTLLTAAIIATAIQMAITWALEEMSQGRHIASARADKPDAPKQ